MPINCRSLLDARREAVQQLPVQQLPRSYGSAQESGFGSRLFDCAEVRPELTILTGGEELVF